MPGRGLGLTGVRAMRAFHLPTVIACLTMAFGAPAYGEAETERDRTGKVSVTQTLDEVFSEPLDPEAMAQFPDDYRLKFQIYTPQNYRPDRPAGLMVYISPTKRGSVPSAWREVFDRRNLIWISVDGSGNEQQVFIRVIEALASLKYAAREYSLDPDRVYLSGLSGGGRTASITMQYYADGFDGVIYMIGVNPWDREFPAAQVTKDETRFVFLTGTQDFNRAETKRVYKAYERAGFKRIKLMDVLGMRHELPKPEALDEAIEFLDSFVEFEAEAPVAD